MSKYKENVSFKDPNNTLNIIYHRVKNRSSVLEVGCASGYFAKYLKIKKGCGVTGIEIEREDAKKAEKYCQLVIKGDVEDESWEKELLGYKFDHIIFADILEHLKDPAIVLERIQKFLSNGGTVLISIPNIAHLSIRLELLQGRFIPEETGILDDTHLKYFTKESFLDMVISAGYRAVWSSQSSFDFPEKIIRQILSKIGLKTTDKTLKLFNSPEAIAYQYIFEIVPNASKPKIINRHAQKPIHIVRDYLKSVNDERKRLRSEEMENIKTLENSNKELKEELALLMKNNQSLKKQFNNLIATLSIRIQNRFKTFKRKLTPESFRKDK